MAAEFDQSQDANQLLQVPSAAVAALICLIAWTSVLLPGFAFPWTNNIFHVPIVLDYANSIEGPHDAFTTSLASFVSWMWPLLGNISTEDNIFWVFFIAHLLGRLIFVTGTYVLVRHFGASRLVALASTALASVAPLFKGLTEVGHNETLSSYLSHTSFAIALLPLCWLLLLRQSWLWAAAALGLLLNINAFVAVWSLVAFAALYFYYNGLHIGVIPKLLAAAALFLLFSAPTLFWILGTLGEPQYEIDFREFLLYRVAYHTFVHVQFEHLALYAAFLLAIAPAAWIAAQADDHRRRPMLLLIVAYLLVFLIAIPLPYLTGSRLLLNLYPLRMDAALNIAAVCLLLCWAASSLSCKRDDKLPFAIGIAALSGNMLAILIVTLLWSHREGRRQLVIASSAAVVCVVVVLLMTGFPPSVGEDFAPLTVLFGGGVILLLAADMSAARYLLAARIAVAASYIWILLSLAGNLGLAGAVCLALFTVLVAIPFDLPGRRQILSAAGAPAMLFGVLAMGAALSGYSIWRGSIVRPDANLGPTLEAQRWFRQTTKPDTYFLPINVNSFGLFSRRPAWAEFQLGAAAMWQPRFHQEWRPRIEQVRACQDTACYADLARDNGIEWLVARPGHLADFERAGLVKAFSNEAVDIFRVPAPSRHREAERL